MCGTYSRKKGKNPSIPMKHVPRVARRSPNEKRNQLHSGFVNLHDAAKQARIEELVDNIVKDVLVRNKVGSHEGVPIVAKTPLNNGCE